MMESNGKTWQKDINTTQMLEKARPIPMKATARPSTGSFAAAPAAFGLGHRFVASCGSTLGSLKRPGKAFKRDETA